MKVLTISQPFASLIAVGAKFVENRNWRTSYYGPIAIHAGSGTQFLTRSELRAYHTGAVIAVARLVNCLHIESIREGAAKWPTACPNGVSRTWSELREHRHTEGLWCWVLEDVTRIKPIPAKGQIGLWDWEPPPGVLIEPIATGGPTP